jgi:heme exporter protein D
MGYVIAAYAVVLGSLLAYGFRVQAQRRALLRRERDEQE